MEITWFGHACCALTDGTTTIITDPYDESLGLKSPEWVADIITVSHDSPRHNAIHLVKGQFKVVDAPGEYEIQGVFISGSALYPDRVKGKKAIEARNIVFVYELDELTVCHLGDISHVPSQSQIDILDNVDVLLIPVGDGRSLNAAKASELIALIEPAIVIPIHYAIPDITIPLDPLDKFLKEMGQTNVEAQPKLRIKRSNLPTETQIIVLTPIME